MKHPLKDSEVAVDRVITVTPEMATKAEDLVSQMAPIISDPGKEENGHIVIGLVIAKLLGLWLASHRCDHPLPTMVYRVQLGQWLNGLAYEITAIVDKSEAEKEAKETSPDLN